MVMFWAATQAAKTARIEIWGSMMMVLLFGLEEQRGSSIDEKEKRRNVGFEIQKVIDCLR